jgi:hypothetical protein
MPARKKFISGTAERLFLGLKGSNLDAGQPADEVLSGNLGALCAREAPKALRGPCALRTYALLITYYITPGHTDGHARQGRGG